jgi:hypothetical protein
MESLARTIDTAIQSNDYASIAQVFSYGPNSWQSVGQGEQRSLAAHFVKAAVSSVSFLPKAFSSAQMMEVMVEALGHLPATVEQAADNSLRVLIFDYKVEEADYSVAARILAGMRMEDDEGSVYYTNPAEKCDGTLKFARRHWTLYLLFSFSLLSFLSICSLYFCSLCQDCRMFSRRR